jgi:hypothetical protein
LNDEAAGRTGVSPKSGSAKGCSHVRGSAPRTNVSPIDRLEPIAQHTTTEQGVPERSQQHRDRACLIAILDRKLHVVRCSVFCLHVLKLTSGNELRQVQERTAGI